MAYILNWLFSESSSDEEPKKRQKKFRRQHRVSDDIDFRTLYRFNREHFNFLVGSFLSDEIDHTSGGGLNATQKMKNFLRYVGDPGFQVINLHVFIVKYIIT